MRTNVHFKFDFDSVVVVVVAYYVVTRSGELVRTFPDVVPLRSYPEKRLDSLCFDLMVVCMSIHDFDRVEVEVWTWRNRNPFYI